MIAFCMIAPPPVQLTLLLLLSAALSAALSKPIPVSAFGWPQAMVWPCDNTTASTQYAGFVLKVRFIYVFVFLMDKKIPL